PLRLDPLPGLLALYGALWMVNTLCFALSGSLRSRLGEQLMLRLRQHLFNHCERLSLAFSRRSHSGRTMALFLSDIPTLAELFSTTVFAGLKSSARVGISLRKSAIVRAPPRSTPAKTAPGRFESSCRSGSPASEGGTAQPWW